MGVLRHALAALPPERDPVPILHEAVDGLQPRSLSVRKIWPPPPGSNPRVVLSASDSLLRLSYPGPHPATQNNPKV